MRQYTDVEQTVEVEGLDLTTIRSPHITFKQGRRTLVDCTDITIDSPTELTIRLTQAQTGKLAEGNVEVELNWFDAAGKRHGSDIDIISAEKNLLDKVMTDG